LFVAKAAVVGAGIMGGEIAQVVASAGVPVLLKDIDPALVDRGLERAGEVTGAQLRRLADDGKLAADEVSDELAQTIGRITGTTDYGGFGDVDIVIEAVPERLEIKQAVFADLDAVTPGHAILASNTSSLSITEIGEGTTRPDRVIGFHFFYPASIMRLVEVIEGDETSEETLFAAAGFARQIRKQPIRCGEGPGFVVNRVLMSAVSELWRVQQEQGLAVEEVDRIIQDAKAAPVGPFFLSDLLGLDTVLHVAEHLHESYGERFFVSAPMRELVKAGQLGEKTGVGFYSHGG